MDAIDLAFYRHQGHVTVNGVFAAAEMDAVVADIEAWGESFLAALPKEQRAWYVDGGVQARTVLRKLDNPHAHRTPAGRYRLTTPRLPAEQPRLPVGMATRLRHYGNLGRTEGRLARLLDEFRFATIAEVVATLGPLPRHALA